MISLLLHYRGDRASRSGGRPASRLSPQSGLTLVELIVVFTILAILSTAALPIARFQVKRAKERELRRDLWAMRSAIATWRCSC